MTLAGVWQGLRQDFNLLEIALVVAGFWAWKSGRLPRLRLPPRFERPWVAAILLVLASVVLRIALLPVLPAPVPVVSDEFSHLLLADTLLHGRAANPTHLFWEHFETLHVLQTPHYGSDYFPGHAAVLAAARAVTGNPWVGILAESAVFPRDSFLDAA